MADRGDTHYSVSALNKWFLFSSAFFLVSLVWLMLADWQRSWKDHQREFRQIELERARAQEEELERLNGELETTLVAKRDAARAALEQQQDELAQAEAELAQAKGALWEATEAAKKDKADYNWTRYLVEEDRLHAGDPNVEAEELEQAEARMNASAQVKEDRQQEVDRLQARVESLRADLDAAQSALSAGIRDLARARDRVEKLAPTDFATRLADKLRDAPGLDFIGPNLKPKKVVLENLTFELNFTKKHRIDMCQTCHLAIDREGYEDLQQPYTAHPRLDLYLSARSPHPLKEVGCTICHRGGGEALEFTRADHRPDAPNLMALYDDHEQSEQWAEEYHWHKQKYWDYPMLPSSMTEAGCVQCHKTSMELIAADAPEVTAGYRNFERYGCYACHKVDWFPTKRKPGPSLKHILSKTTPEFIASWISNPKSFRPTTWMPRFFHLENFGADDVVAVSDYGQGPPVLGQQWNDTAVAAVTAFVASKATEKDLPPIPVEGDATRGAEVFRVSGCLACHNVAPWEDDPDLPNDPALVPSGENEFGPNLRGVATKVSPEWLYAWIKDPAAWWSETRMPNLRLSDQDAADIVAYMTEDPDGFFTDTPEEWQPHSSPADPTALAEMARWFFARDGRNVIRKRLAGEDPERRWDEPDVLLRDVGEKLVMHYGCYSCHEIEGLEQTMPIGVELTNWASKTVDKLDFAFMPQILAEQHGWTLEQEKTFKEYREGWLMTKLDQPRSFDRQKVKNPIEKLRMPWFQFTPEQIHSIATFVAGLVDDEVQRARMVPDAGQAASEAGLRAIRQHNCMACHMIDPGTVSFLDDEGHEHTVTAELLPIGDALQPVAHDREALGEELDYWDESEVPLRLLADEPGFGAVGDKLFLEDVDRITAMSPPRGGDFIHVITDYYFNGQELYDAEAEDPDQAYYGVTADPDGDIAVQDVDGAFRAYYDQPYDKVRWTFAPPVLWDEGGKIRKEWLFSFLNDVYPIRPQIRVRMPSFHLASNEAGAIAEYLAVKSSNEWPARYTRHMLQQLGLTPEDVAADSKLSADDVRAIMDGDPVTTKAQLPKLMAFASSRDYSDFGPVDPSFETWLRRSDAYLAQRAKDLPGHLAIGEHLAVDKVNCFQCHFRMGTPPPADPVAWAPDLMRAWTRLREDWTQRWLQDPSSIYPGTSMPQNFADNASDYHDVYPNSTNAEQIEAVLDWLYNFDRVTMTSQN